MSWINREDPCLSMMPSQLEEERQRGSGSAGWSGSGLGGQPGRVGPAAAGWACAQDRLPLTLTLERMGYEVMSHRAGHPAASGRIGKGVSPGGGNTTAWSITLLGRMFWTGR